MRSLLLSALVLALSTSAAYAEVPARSFPSAHDTGPLREQPQAMSHWQKMAEDMADEAAPALRAARVAVSSRAAGQRSSFDAAFHDFLVTALHNRNIPVTSNAYGARVEIDTYSEEFYNARSTARVFAPRGQERYRLSVKDELAVNVRIFNGGDLLFSGSTTYYLPKSDLRKYEDPRVQYWRDVRSGKRYESGSYQGPALRGEYGTKTWNCSPDLSYDCN